VAGSAHQAKRYAQAVFEIAQSNKETDRWLSDLRKIAAIAQNADLAGAIDNPRFSLEQKTRLLKNQLRDIGPLAMNLVLILTSQGNFSLVGEIYYIYQGLIDSFKNIEKAEIITAVPLEESEKSRLVAYLETITSKKITLVERVDPDIIGGLVARVGGKIVDGSTLSQLAFLKNNLARASG
jgi:F-type H+-transporting ATPase subunit delta